MKASITTFLAGIAALTIASAPLAASAANWNDGHDRGGNDRGSYHVQYNGGNRGGYQARGDWGHRGYAYGGGYAYAAPAYVNGYFGWAPGGFQGWYYNGGWYHHRRWNGGIWIYF